MKNIGIISTRISGTDGVSHEIEKWAWALERNGFSCFYCAGEVDRPGERCMVVDEAHFKHPDIAAINRSVFGSHVRKREVTRLIHAMTAHLRQELARFIQTFDIDCVIAENTLAIPMNIPLGVAMTELVAETGIPAVAHHHDFAWERERYLVNAAGDFIQMSFPPVLPSVHHVVINSLAQASLAHRRGVTSTVIPNTFDYGNPPAAPDTAVVESLRREAGVGPGELLVLQPTRVVPRKCIERAVDLVGGLAGAGKRLVISHPSGDEGDEYERRLREYAEMRGVTLAFIDHIVSPGRAASKDRPYTIGDVYRAADLVTYPSSYEGFGNAFLETVYFGKPIVMNRYPVFIADIEPKGFDLCLINGMVTGATIREVEGLLADAGSRARRAEHNYRVAKENFSYEKLEELLLGVMRGLRPLSPGR
ncbi:MAG TPA: glycosyltransferase family 4 protein [Spirochaetota bacterium]|nr:glycosyltransferase family 4 protein [Spirochaetota bacterium]HPC41126.1 glycosyltransferase family 4 protein [Spirochaetota bacterium]HQF07046.1 glycosyltransferase family 4 protein [Spirochaetota bacterium]HQH95783.1 glycosyltransferase family 4 protein [Spirochaetota bacterium]HQJ71663.1 glycosyltransferase family 4 protein [Spirochaetota bacterium]